MARRPYPDSGGAVVVGLWDVNPLTLDGSKCHLLARCGSGPMVPEVDIMRRDGARRRVGGESQIRFASQIEWDGHLATARS